MFYTVRQNNSGGYFIKNDDVDRFVIAEANNVGEAKDIFTNILYDYREYCECCGERWDDDWLNEQNADEEPCIYGEPIRILNDRYSCEDVYVVVYYLDGIKLKFNLETKEEEIWL